MKRFCLNGRGGRRPVSAASVLRVGGRKAGDCREQVRSLGSLQRVPRARMVRFVYFAHTKVKQDADGKSQEITSTNRNTT